MKIIILTRTRSSIPSCSMNLMKPNQSQRMLTLILYSHKTVFLKKKTFNRTDKEIEEKGMGRIRREVETTQEMTTETTKEVEVKMEIGKMIGKGDESHGNHMI